MDFPVHGYNECLIMYILAAASPTHGVPAAVYHEGWAQNGAIVDPHKVENIELHLRYQGTEAGPLFWAQYSFLGLDPIGLKDEYCADYFDEMRNLTLVNRAYCVRNPKHYKGFGPDCWGLTASYSVNGYAAHAPNERDDQGVISPTAALVVHRIYTGVFAASDAPPLRHGRQGVRPLRILRRFQRNGQLVSAALSCHRPGPDSRHARELSVGTAVEALHESSGCAERVEGVGVLNSQQVTYYHKKSPSETCIL